MALDPVTAALEIGTKVIERIWPNPEQRAAAQLELLKLQQSGELAAMTAEVQIAKGQTDINAVEAQSTRLFVAGWRPFVGWVCGAAFGWNWIGLPMAQFIAAAIGHPVTLPAADMSDMLPVLLGMLGLGAMRSVEKVKKVA